MKQVYFLRRADGTGPIKIGCSWSPKARIKQLCSDYRATLVILADAPGDFTVERNVLLKFADHRVEHPNARGKAQCEWFAPVAELLAYIELVKRSGIIPLVTGECRERIMRDRYLGGETLEAISRDYGITRERVRQILRNTGVPSLGCRPEHFRKTITPEIEAKIVELGKSGCAQRDIAKTLGVHPLSVSIYIRRHGITPPRAKRARRPDVLERAKGIAADYRAGMKTAEIGRKYGVPQPTIYHFLRIEGVEPGRLAKIAA